MTDQGSAAPRVFPFGLIPLAGMFAVLMFAGVLVTPDRVRSTVAADQFNTTAALERLTRVLGDERPHPVDTPAQDAVRERLLGEIRALGFRPEVHESFTCRPLSRGPIIECGRVANVIWSIGPANAPAVMAAAHYDSVPAGPGAGDDGSAVSIWLEVARILSTEQLQRRVLFVLTDGEEPGLLGAWQFANHDPLMTQVESLVNLDSRGNRGPAIFYESNDPNADAITAFASAPRPVANSIAAAVSRLLPNSSDVSALRRDGLDIINVAYLDGLEDYHTPQDTLASLDQRSVQHMGDIALAVTRRLAHSADRDDPSSMVYTDIAARFFVAMPSWAGQAGLALAALVAFFMFWRHGKDARWRTLAAPLVSLIIAGLGAAAFGFAISALRPAQDYAAAYPEAARAWCALLGLFGVIAAWSLMRASRKPTQAAAMGMFWFALIGLVLSIFLSGASILFVLPALLYATGALISLAWRPAHLIGAIVAGMLALLVAAPTFYLFELALGFAYPFGTSILIAIVAWTLLGAIFAAQGATGLRAASTVVGVAALAAFVISLLLPAATVARPQPLNINYVVDTTSNQARISAGTAERALPADFAGVFAPEHLIPGDRSDTWTAPTALAPAPAPTLESLTLTEEGGQRVVRGTLRLNGAYRASLRWPAAAMPLSVAINGVTTTFADTGAKPGDDTLSFGCTGRACDGASLTITLAGEGAPSDWVLVGQAPGAPAPPPVAALRGRRPASATPIQNGDSVVTLTRLRPIGG